MTRAIDDSFARAKERGRAAFMPFVVGGFPDPQSCMELITGLDAAGADLIEIGIPFSDPIADGPVIQQAGTMALAAGVTPRSVLELVAEASGRVRASLVLMTYLNPVLAMGMNKFAEEAARAGASGVIVPDLLPDDAGEWRAACTASGLDTVFMAATTTGAERLSTVARASRGFLYYVPLTGVTGSELRLSDALQERIRRARAAAGLPLAVGFGVARPEQAAALAPHADGVIVGSALVRRVLEAGANGGAVDSALDLAGRMAAAMGTG